MASVLVSCAVGKPYARTDLQMPEAYKESVQVTGDTVVLPWKTFFKDPKLVGLIDKALTRNNEVNVALKNIEQLLTLNIMAVVRLSHAISQQFIQKKSGAIINLGSVVGLAPEFGLTLYGCQRQFKTDPFYLKNSKVKLTPLMIY